MGQAGRGDCQKAGDPFAIGEEPRFNRPHGDAKTHMVCGVRKPLSAQLWWTLSVLVEVDEDDPGTEACCVVIASKPLPKVTLSALSIHRA
jgi:hypothetical protein